MGTSPVAHGWSGREAFNAQPTRGWRAFGVGQRGAFSIARETESPTTDEHVLLVNIVKWLSGKSSGTVWAPKGTTINVNFQWTGYTAVDEISTASAAALTSAGFTVTHEDDPTKQFAPGDYDVIIVGTGDAWGSGLDNTERSTQIANFINNTPNGGVLYLRDASEWIQPGVGNIRITMGSSFIHNIRRDSSICYDGSDVAAGLGQCLPEVFTAGMILRAEAPHYIGIDAEPTYLDWTTRGEGALDGDDSCAVPSHANPYRHFAWYSGYDDLNGKIMWGD